MRPVFGTNVPYFITLGLSWHVMVVLWKSSEGVIQLKTMVFLMGNVKQVFMIMPYSYSVKIMIMKDWFVGLSNLESLVTYLKANDLPDLEVKIGCQIEGETSEVKTG